MTKAKKKAPNSISGYGSAKNKVVKISKISLAKAKKAKIAKRTLKKKKMVAVRAKTIKVPKAKVTKIVKAKTTKPKAKVSRAKTKRVRSKLATAKTNTVAKVTRKRKATVKRKNTTKRKPNKRRSYKRARNKVTIIRETVNNDSSEMSSTTFGYLVGAIFELVMAIPVIGWMMGAKSFGLMWVVGIIIHVTVITVLVKYKKPIYANTVGAAANVFGIVPFIGWALHLISMVLLFILFFEEENKKN